MDLLLHDAEEAARDRAEGERLAYVAATRARDILVIPTIGDEVYEGGWLDPLMPAIYPPSSVRRSPGAAAGCPAFPSKDTVLTRADSDPAKPTTVAPGLFEFVCSSPVLGARGSRIADPGFRTADPGSRIPNTDTYRVVWWDPHSLVLQAPNLGGLRRDDLIAKDGDQAGVEKRMGEYRAWQADRASAIARARTPSVLAHTATELAHEHVLSARLDDEAVEVIDLPRAAARPFGPRFGSLVHATLATVPLDAPPDAVRSTAHTHARLLLANDVEAAAAAEAVTRALAHPLFARVRAASAAGRCSRECPVLWRASDGSVIEGTVDVVFEEGDDLVVVDFKTDREPAEVKDQYERQLTLYCRAFATLRGRRARGVLVRI
jgi:hypothetical protein